MTRGPSRRPRASRQKYDWSRRFYIAHLHRPPCRWDVLLHELSLALAKKLASAGRRMTTATFGFRGLEAQTVGWVLAKGMDLLVGQDWPKAEGAEQVSLWPLNKESALAIARQITTRCFDPLLRKYVWDARGVYAGRPHGDLARLGAALAEGLDDFLVTRCLDGDLADCLARPMAQDGRYFHQAAQGAMPLTSTGMPSQDVQRLGLTIAADDDGGQIKRKLVHLVRDDPWLYAEWRSFVEHRLEDRDVQQPITDALATDRATDDFIFRATRLDGKTPLQVLLERQADMSNHQRQRLMRWDAEAFVGAFLIREIQVPMVSAIDLETDREFRLEATKPQALGSMQQGDLLLSRVVPWDDRWLLSGVQQRHEQVPDDRIQQIRKSLRQKPSRRTFDPNDPRIIKAFHIQEEQYQAWLTLFGKDELLFADGLELGAAINRFYRHWAEMVEPTTGLSRSEAFRKQYGKEPPSQMFPLPDDLLKAQDVAAIFDRRHGLSFFVGYGEFLSAFESNGLASAGQVERVWDYLSDESVEYWVFQRMAERYPNRTEEVLRAVLRDGALLLRDIDALLGRFKGEAMRQPVRPMVTMVDLADEMDCPPRQEASP